MAVQRAVAERWKQVTGNPLTQAWGLTETSPAACINPPDAPEFNGSIGLPISSTDDHHPRRRRQRAADRPVGRDLRAGPQVMRGYWNRPDETEKVMLPGELAAHRRHRPHGRARLRVHRGPQEGHDPRVRLQRVSERGRGRRGHASRRARGRRPSHSRTSAPAKSWRCSWSEGPRADRGGPHRVLPQGSSPATRCRSAIYFRDELPKTNVGKILRRELKDQLKK